VRSVSPGYVACGLVASHPDVRDAPGMSAVPPIATQLVSHNEASQCANRVITRRSKKSTDHRLAGAIDVTAQAVARIEKPFVNSMWKP